MSSKRILAVLWGSYLLLLLYWAFRFWGHFPAFMDTLEYVYPEKWFNVESFRQGRIPLWNPLIACGTPHLANWQSAFFYPLFWIWNMTGLANWLFSMALFHALLASVGFYFWLRVLQILPVPATLCALGFGGSALATFYWGFPTHLAALAWIPWVGWATLRFFKAPTLWNGLGVSLFGALHLLAGYPLFTFYGGLFLAWFIYWNHRPGWKLWGQYLSALGLSLFVTACQWLPFLDFLGYLHREGWGEDIYSLRWANFLTLLQPQLLGFPGTAGYQGDYPSFIFNNLYLGIMPLGWFLWTLFSFRRFRESFWKLSTLFWFFWLAGSHFPVWRLLPQKWISALEPTKASFLFLFCAMTSIGLTLQEKIQFSSKKNPFFIWAWVLGTVWLLDILLVPSRILHLVPDPYRDPGVIQNQSVARQLTSENRFVSLRNRDNNYSDDPQTFSDAFLDRTQALLPNTNVVAGVRSPSGYLSIYVDGFQNLVKYLSKGFPYDGRVLDVAGVRLVILPQVLKAFKYHVVGQQGSSLWETNAGAMGTAWEVSAAREFPGRAEAFGALLNPKAFLENEVYTEKAADGKAVRLEPTQRSLSGGSLPSWGDRLSGFWQRIKGAGDTIQNSRPSPCQADFRVNFEEGGFLVFDETFAPGWHAWVDGIPQTIFRAYGYWMAVPVKESGVHQITFRYEPTAFRLGLFLSLVTFVSLVMALVLKWRLLFESFVRSYLKI